MEHPKLYENKNAQSLSTKRPKPDGQMGNNKDLISTGHKSYSEEKTGYFCNVGLLYGRSNMQITRKVFRIKKKRVQLPSKIDGLSSVGVPPPPLFG